MFTDLASHRITDWLDWKGPLEVTWSDILAQSGPPRKIAQNHVYTAFQHLQRWRFHILSGQPFPMLSQPHHKKVFPDVVTEPAVFQVMLIASGPVTGNN